MINAAPYGTGDKPENAESINLQTTSAMNTALRFNTQIQEALKPYMLQEPRRMYGDPETESNKGNAQYVYGERLAALFGTCVVAEGATPGFVHFSVYPSASFACNVSQLTVTGVREGRFHMMMKLEDLENQEAIEELYNKSGI